MIQVFAAIFLIIFSRSSCEADNLSLKNTTFTIHSIKYIDYDFSEISNQHGGGSIRQLIPPLITIDSKGRLSAKLENVTLAEVKNFFEQNYEIKFIGANDLFQSHLSIFFNKLSLEAALKRFFSKTNFVLKYNSEGNITQINLLPTSHSKGEPTIANTLANNRQRQYRSEKQDTSVSTKDEITSFQVDENFPPPGDTLEVDAESPALDPNFQVDSISPALDPDFQVIPNSPPSGVDFQIVPSSPPSRK